MLSKKNVKSIILHRYINSNEVVIVCVCVCACVCACVTKLPYWDLV